MNILPETYLSGTKNSWHIIHKGMPLCQGTKDECLQYAKLHKIQLPDVYWSGYTIKFINQNPEPEVKELYDLYFSRNKNNSRKHLDMLIISENINKEYLLKEFWRIDDTMNDLIIDSKEWNEFRIYNNFIHNQIKNRS